MNNKPDFIKKTLCNLIESMAENVDTFVKHPGKDFTRHRTFDFQTIFKFILSAGCNTLASELMDFFGFQSFPSVSAFVQQREKILPEAFHYLLKTWNETLHIPPVLFHGYQLLAVDGSELTLPFNPKEERTIRTKDHCNFLHLNTLYDVCSKRYVDASFYAGAKGSETAAAVDLVKGLPDTYPVILIADRGYETYNLFAHMEERLFDYVIRIKDTDSTGILSGIDFPNSQEFDITKRIVITRHSTGPAAVNPKGYKYLSKQARFDFITDSKAPDYELLIRFVRFQLKDGSYEVLATSLSEETASTQLLKQIYHLRWEIETSYRLSKWALGMVSYHSKKSECIMQEVYADLIMYNFSMYICGTLQTDGRGRKHPQQVNFTLAIKICLHYFRSNEIVQTFDVEATILRFLLPVRHGRSFPRKAVSPSVVCFNYRLP